MSEWINVKDRLPENEDAILCWQKYDDEKLSGPRVMRYRFNSFEGPGFGSVTYWQPLPEPPKDDYIEIKPCPFCGSEPRIKMEMYLDKYCNPSYDVECFDCEKAGTKERWISVNLAIEAWNKRENKT